MVGRLTPEQLRLHEILRSMETILHLIACPSAPSIGDRITLFMHPVFNHHRLKINKELTRNISYRG